MADIEVGGDLLQLGGDFVGRADNYIAALDDVADVGRGARLLACGKARRPSDLPLDTRALGRLGDIAGRHRPARVDAQAAAVKIFGRLAVEPHRLLATLGDTDRLQKPRTIG